METQQQPKPRKTVGRKPLSENGTKFIGYKAGVETKERIAHAAASLGLNNSDIIRTAVEQWLDKFDKFH